MKMVVEKKEAYLSKQEMKRTKSRRCLLCGTDQEILYPMIIKINNQSWVKLNEVAVFGKDFKLNSTGFHQPKIDGTVDDLNLKPINGPSYEVSIEICLECINKIGYRHKFKKKYVQKLYATKQI